MTKAHLEELKRLITEAKTRSPKRPIYSETVRTGIGRLAKQLSKTQIKEKFGVSVSYIEKIKRSTLATKPSNQNNTNITPAPTPALQFLELPSTILKKDIDTSKRFMKVTTATGISIEIWG